MVQLPLYMQTEADMRIGLIGGMLIRGLQEGAQASSKPDQDQQGTDHANYLLHETSARASTKAAVRQD